MKVKNLLIVICLFASMTLRAQPPGGGSQGHFDPAEMVKRQTQEMIDSLALNEDQSAKVQTLNEKYSEKMQEMFKDGPDGDFEAMKTKMDKIRTDKEDELKGILSKEQFAKYKEIEENRMKHRPNGSRPDGDSPSGRRGQSRGTGN